MMCVQQLRLFAEWWVSGQVNLKSDDVDSADTLCCIEEPMEWDLSMRNSIVNSERTRGRVHCWGECGARWVGEWCREACS